jgi:hypothetical protein
MESARTREAIDLLERAIDKGPLTQGDAEGAFMLAAKFADPRAAEHIFQGYARAMAGKVPEDLAAHHRMRQESARRLLELWPSLGLKFDPTR